MSTLLQYCRRCNLYHAEGKGPPSCNPPMSLAERQLWVQRNYIRAGFARLGGRALYVGYGAKGHFLQHLDDDTDFSVDVLDVALNYAKEKPVTAVAICCAGEVWIWQKYDSHTYAFPYEVWT